MLQFIKETIGILFLHLIAAIIGYYIAMFYSRTPYELWDYPERIIASLPILLMFMLTTCYIFELITKSGTNDHKQCNERLS